MSTATVTAPPYRRPAATRRPAPRAGPLTRRGRLVVVLAVLGWRSSGSR